MLIRVDAHEWVQALPLTDNKVKCVHCGFLTGIKSIPVGGCNMRYEASSSGFKEAK